MVTRILFFLILVLMNQAVCAKRISMIHMGRRYLLVSPTASVTKRPLVVLLHGCLQDPALILEGTNFEAEALKYNFHVLAPEQPSLLNIDKCWNWFMSHEQVRVPTNEMGQIVGAVDFVSKTVPIERDKIYVAGLSAGGALAHNLMSCYPDVFAGSAIHSGVNFRAAENLLEARPILTSYRQKSSSYLAQRMLACSGFFPKKLKKVLIIHGDEDRSVLPLHADLISSTTAAWRDLLDDGVRNDSDQGRSSSENIKFTNGYEVEKTDTVFSNLVERKLVVRGLPHAWGGGKPVSVHFEPKAPSSTKFILDFFSLVQ